MNRGPVHEISEKWNRVECPYFLWIYWISRKEGPGDGGFENMVGPRIMRKRGKRAYTLT